MSRVSKKQVQSTPDERSSWNRWAPLGIVGFVLVMMLGLAIALDVLT